MSKPVLGLLFLAAIAMIARGQDPLTAKSEENFDQFATSILPDTTVVYLRIEPAEKWLNHPLRQLLQTSQVVQTVWKSKPLQPLRAGITMTQMAIGDSLESIFRSLSVDGIHVVVDKKTQGIAVLSKTRGERWLKTYLQRVANLARSDASSKKSPDPIKDAVYRDVRGFEINRVVVAQLSDCILITNKSDLAKSIIDRYRDKTADSLRNSDFLQKATSLKKANATTRTDNSASETAYVFVDLNELRKAGVARDLLQSKQRDFGAELILGGIFKVLNETPLASASLSFEPLAAQLHVSVPTNTKAVCETHEFFVGPSAQGFAQNWMESKQGLASISTYRNLSELWLRAGDLFDQNVNDQLAQADNTLTTLFAGKDFGTDILGALEPQLQILVSPQSFQQDLKPAIRLPSFAIVGKLKDSTKMTRELKRTFQSFIGFLNVAGAMEGQPQLDLNSETLGTSQFHWGEYVVDVDKKYEQGLPIQFNFSPTIAFQGEQVVLASSIDFAKKLLGPATTSTMESASSMDSNANTIASIDVQSLRTLLVDNREQLISQNMLEKGHSQKEASAEIDLLLSLLSLVKQANATLAFRENSTLQLRLEMQSDAWIEANTNQRK